MHIHLPKPLHGWREFVGEVGIVVVGVLIALGAEQVVEAVHHRSQVHDAIDRLRAESVQNRQVIAFDTTILRQAIADVDADTAALNNCRSAASPGLQLLARPRYLLPENAAWQGLRDSAVLPLMPEDLAHDYWVLDISKSFVRSDTERMNDAFVQGAGAVASVRQGAADRHVCDEALISLDRLRQAEADLLQRTAYNGEENEQVLRGGQPMGLPPRQSTDG